MCEDGVCRREVSLQSYSPSNIELGLRNADFGGLGDFTVGSRGLLIFGGALLNYTRTGYYVKVGLYWNPFSNLRDYFLKKRIIIIIKYSGKA